MIGKRFSKKSIAPGENEVDVKARNWSPEIDEMNAVRSSKTWESLFLTTYYTVFSMNGQRHTLLFLEKMSIMRFALRSEYFTEQLNFVKPQSSQNVVIHFYDLGNFARKPNTQPASALSCREPWRALSADWWAERKLSMKSTDPKSHHVQLNDAEIKKITKISPGKRTSKSHQQNK